MTSAHVEETLIGVFAVTERGDPLEKATWRPNPKKVAQTLLKIREGEITREVARVLDGLVKRGFDRVTFVNAELAESVHAQYFIEVEVVESSPASDKLRERLPALARQLRVVASDAAFHELGREVSTLIARGAVQEAMGGKEALINQTVQLAGELDVQLNTLSSRVREWYGLHYPELSRVVRDHQQYCKLVVGIGSRTGITEEKLTSLGFQPRETTSILKSAPQSMGAELEPGDLERVAALARRVLDLYAERDGINEYTSRLAAEAAPNVSALCGPLLAAKLISRAGTVKKLAMMPASRLQIIGAEKALYRAVKTRARPPKHGLIFQHPYVNGAPRGLRGLRARHMAAKVSIAARADAFSGSFIAEDLKKDLGLV